MTTLHQATLLSVLLFFLAACQPEDSAESAATPPSDAVVIGSHHTLTSRILDEEREYRVYLPDSYDSETYLPQAYPVIYVLDGESHFHALSGTVRHMSAGINGNVQIPQAIVVAILNSDRRHRPRARLLLVRYGTTKYEAEAPKWRLFCVYGSHTGRKIVATTTATLRGAGNWVTPMQASRQDGNTIPDQLFAPTGPCPAERKS